MRNVGRGLDPADQVGCLSGRKDRKIQKSVILRAWPEESEKILRFAQDDKFGSAARYGKAVPYRYCVGGVKTPPYSGTTAEHTASFSLIIANFCQKVNRMFWENPGKTQDNLKNLRKNSAFLKILPQKPLSKNKNQGIV